MAYEAKGRTTKISATSRVSLKIRDNFYTIEASEERSIPETGGVDVTKEHESLFGSLNDIVDSQIQEIVKTFK